MNEPKVVMCSTNQGASSVLLRLANTLSVSASGWSPADLTQSLSRSKRRKPTSGAGMPGANKARKLRKVKKKMRQQSRKR